MSSIEQKQIDEILKLTFKFNGYYNLGDDLYFRVCYKNESKNIKMIKYL